MPEIKNISMMIKAAISIAMPAFAAILSFFMSFPPWFRVFILKL